MFPHGIHTRRYKYVGDPHAIYVKGHVYEITASRNIFGVVKVQLHENYDMYPLSVQYFRNAQLFHQSWKPAWRVQYETRAS